MPPTTFREVMDLWPNRRVMGEDVSRFAPESRMPSIYAWSQRDSIPPVWFDAVIEAAKARGFEEVTFRLLSDISRGRT